VKNDKLGNGVEETGETGTSGGGVEYLRAR